MFFTPRKHFFFSFAGEEGWLRERGVEVKVLNDPSCVELMARFMAQNPALWNEDIGV